MLGEQRDQFFQLDHAQRAFAGFQKDACALEKRLRPRSVKLHGEFVQQVVPSALAKCDKQSFACAFEGNSQFVHSSISQLVD